MENNKYDSGKIYKLQCNDYYYYIGSTINELSLRLKNHKSDSQKYGDRRVYSHINDLGWENVSMELIELYPCDTRKELVERETYYIQQAKDNFDMFCLNMNNAFVSYIQRKENMIEYYNKNKEDICKKAQTYRIKNSEKIKKYRKIYNKVFSGKRIEYQKKYVAQNKENVIKARKVKYEKNKEKERQQMKQYHEKHKDDIATYKKKWAENNKEALAKKRKEYQKTHKENIQSRGKEYYEANKDVINEKNRQYYKDNKEKYDEYAAKRNVQVVCECGAICLKNNLSKHTKTKKHTNWLTTSPTTVKCLT